MFFWYVFVRQTAAGSAQGNIIITSGFVSMITGMFLFAGPHDILLNIASFAGLVAVITILIVLHKHKYYGLFWMGICNLFLVILNNILYYGEGLQIYLPVVQKFTFLFFLVWIAFLNIKVVNGLKHTLPGFSSQD